VPADATSAPSARNVVAPFGSIAQARRLSFSPHEQHRTKLGVAPKHRVAVQVVRLAIEQMIKVRHVLCIDEARKVGEEDWRALLQDGIVVALTKLVGVTVEHVKHAILARAEDQPGARDNNWAARPQIVILEVVIAILVAVNVAESREPADSFKMAGTGSVPRGGIVQLDEALGKVTRCGLSSIATVFDTIVSGHDIDIAVLVRGGSTPGLPDTGAQSVRRSTPCGGLAERFYVECDQPAIHRRVARQIVLVRQGTP
jgi:hypothetical protein